MQSIIFLITLLSVGNYILAKELRQDEIPLEEVKKFTTVMQRIKNLYVNETSDSELFDNAIKGMLHNLDPHSAYLQADAFAALQSTTRGNFGGLGIRVTTENSYIKVIAPIDGTPAKLAGIQTGDYIIKVDNTAMYNLGISEAISLMRGDPGSSVKLTIIRKAKENPLEFTMTRELIAIPSLKYDLLADNYGYIRISQFQGNTASEFITAVNLLNKTSNYQIKGLILDLRNNPGGLLDAAIEIADALIHNDEQGKEEVIVYTKGRSVSSDFTAVASSGDLLQGRPIVVLINAGSASASEVVAGALQDNKRAVLAGSQTFGKGSVQTFLPLDEHSGMKITTSLYYTPSGRSIQAVGLQPDITLADQEVTESTAELVSENNLANHIEQADKPTKKLKQAIANPLLDDYQIKQALNLLKVMHISQRQNSN